MGLGALVAASSLPHIPTRIEQGYLDITVTVQYPYLPSSIADLLRSNYLSRAFQEQLESTPNVILTAVGAKYKRAKIIEVKSRPEIQCLSTT